MTRIARIAVRAAAIAAAVARSASGAAARFCLNDGACDGGFPACTISRCVNNACQAPVLIDCGDNDVCTVDTCFNGVCSHERLCPSEGAICNGIEVRWLPRGCYTEQQCFPVN